MFLSRVAPVRYRGWAGLSRPSSRLSSSSSPSAPPSPLPRACVIGAGPSGFYSTELLVRSGFEVDLVERWPVPFGLVRFGVAADHPEVKSVQTRFTEIASSPRVRYLGHVEAGRDLSWADLCSHYSLVLLAYGAQFDRPLLVPGEHLKGVGEARSLVAWLNGEPQATPTPPWAELLRRVRRVAVVGNGNVALDVARILLRTPSELEGTDLSRVALEVLRGLAVEEVHVLGRRGAVQAACTTKELRELSRLEGVEVQVGAEAMRRSEADAVELKERATQRKVQLIEELVRKGQGREGGPGQKRLRLHFLKAVSEIEGDAEGRVVALRLRPLQLMGAPHAQQALPSEEESEERLPVDLVVRSVGYASAPIFPALPWDERRFIVPSLRGLVPPSPTPSPHVGVVGWLKRGPQGILGTNLMDAEETVAALVEAHRGGPYTPPRRGEDMGAVLRARGVQVVDWRGWERIDAFEREAAAREGRGAPRIKLLQVEDMLRVAEGK